MSEINLPEYNFKKIEKKWRKKWKDNNVYKTTEDKSRKKCYILDMFPYPSGTGLHVGHPRGYIATDILSRTKKMQGYNVLHPMGWDAFGLPAEQYALKKKIHPAIAVKKNIETFKKQLKKISLNYDWDREFSTTDPTYYKWTQWAFIQMFKKGLVFRSNEPINWCPSCKTGLANEDLEGGACERCGSKIEKRKLPQWVIKITDYADRLLSDLNKLEWRENIKQSQRNWIGRSEGVNIDFEIKGTREKISVFTVCPERLFGVTHLVIAPEHKIIKKTIKYISNIEEVKKYQKKYEYKTNIERVIKNCEKTGIELRGIMAVNPINSEEISIFVAEHVSAKHNTDAIMAVPAHDEQDWIFAKKNKLPIIKTIEPKNSCVIVKKQLLNKFFYKEILFSLCYKEKNGFVIIETEDVDGTFALIQKYFTNQLGYIYSEGLTKKILFHKGEINKIFSWGSIQNCKKAKAYGLSIGIEKKQLKWEDFYCITITDGKLINAGEFNGIESSVAKKIFTDKVKGKMAVKYKLRDWVFSRQRYWGEPIPLVYCKKCEWVPVPEKDLPLTLPKIDSYSPTGTGESPLAAITDWVNTTCPHCGGIAKRETNTMPQWAGSSWYHLRFIDPHNNTIFVNKTKEKYWSPVDFYVGGAEHATRHLIYARFWHKFLYDIGVVSCDEPYKKLQTVGLIIAEDGRKMSKRWGNVINPDEIIENFGADAFRLYEMFMGPFDATIVWNAKNIIGAKKFLERIWNFGQKGVVGGFVEKTNILIAEELNKTIKKVGEDIEKMKYNTAIAQIMVFTKAMEKYHDITVADFGMLLRILSPFCPHITQELWLKIGNKTFLINETWPIFSMAENVNEKIKIAIQVNGKVRDQMKIMSNANQIDVEKDALKRIKVQKYLGKKALKKVIYVKGRLLSIVV